MRTSETRTIPLTRGLTTIVDSSDYDVLARHKWFAHNRKGLFYAARNSKGHPDRVTISMHREIVCCLTGFEIDHINGNTLDNRRANLRITDRYGNSRNIRVRKDNTSGYKGVYLHYGKWKTSIQVNHKRLVFGGFLSPENAAIAYNIAALKHFGEYAVLNVESSNAN